MLNFNALLEPISAANPTGADETFSVSVDAISKARQFDDPSLDQGEWVTDVKEADWVFVYEKCQEFLATESKDLKIASWLVEAAAKVKQFEGMAAGLELITQLCKRYWDSIHPQGNDKEDFEQRAGNIRWLLARSTQLIKEIPLTEGRTTRYAWNDFEAARLRSNNAAKQGSTVADANGQPSLVSLEAARRKSSKAFYQFLLDSINHCQSKAIELESILDTKLGGDGPSFSPLKDALDTIHKTVGRYGADVGLKVLGAEPVETQFHSMQPLTPQTANTANIANTAFAVTISSREQALDQLRKIAEFFRATEPHSPVAYLADKAAGWGDLPLHSWLKTVVKDPNSLLFVEEMLGVGTATNKDDNQAS